MTPSMVALDLMKADSTLHLPNLVASFHFMYRLRLARLHITPLASFTSFSLLYLLCRTRMLAKELVPGMDSWEQLGTNLSVKVSDNFFGSEPERLLLIDADAHGGRYADENEAGGLWRR